MRRIVTFILLILIQFLLNDYINVGQYLMLTVIPLMILSLPQKWSATAVMTAGFALALLADMMSDGVLGLNAAAATLLGLSRNFLFDATIGNENSDLPVPASPQSVGTGKYSVYLLLAVALYLLVYILLDGIGARPFGFFLMRLVCSVAADFCLSLFIGFTLVNER